jgi:hypothetical protein
MSRPLGERQLRNRAVQAELYGAPLGDVRDELTAAFEVSRGAVAHALGLSAPMLSQLASGHRVMIGNPSAVQRLQRLLGSLPDIRAGRLDAGGGDAVDRGGGPRAGAHPDLPAGPAAGRCRRAAGAPLGRLDEELGEAAALLEERFPGLAEVLRVYATGRDDQALTHFERVVAR